MFEFKYSFNFVPVSTDFIENYMPKAHGDYVKVYLYILGMAIQGGADEPRRIAKALNMLEGDVLNAIEYWQEQGLLSADGNTMIMGADAKQTQIAAQNPIKIPVVTPSPNQAQTSNSTAKPQSVSRQGRSMAQINESIMQDPRLQDLCTMAQEILGAQLNNPDIETLYWIYDQLGLSTDVITMLLEYCVSKNKRSMKYIEQTAIAWHEQGITTINAADEFISKSMNRETFLNELKQILGIQGRPYSKTEEQYLLQWRDDYNMSAEMVALAYEWCIMQTGKLSFQYMDAIIRNWVKKNVHSIEAAEKDKAEFKSSKGGKKSERETSVYSVGDTDLDEIERKMNEKYN